MDPSKQSAVLRLLAQDNNKSDAQGRPALASPFGGLSLLNSKIGDFLEQAKNGPAPAPMDIEIEEDEVEQDEEGAADFNGNGDHDGAEQEEGGVLALLQRVAGGLVERKLNRQRAKKRLVQEVEPSAVQRRQSQDDDGGEEDSGRESDASSSDIDVMHFSSSDDDHGDDDDDDAADNNDLQQRVMNISNNRNQDSGNNNNNNDDDDDDDGDQRVATMPHEIHMNIIAGVLQQDVEEQQRRDASGGIILPTEAEMLKQRNREWKQQARMLTLVKALTGAGADSALQTKQ